MHAEDSFEQIQRGVTQNPAVLMLCRASRPMVCGDGGVCGDSYRSRAVPGTAVPWRSRGRGIRHGSRCSRTWRHTGALTCACPGATRPAPLASARAGPSVARNSRERDQNCVSMWRVSRAEAEDRRRCILSRHRNRRCDDRSIAPACAVRRCRRTGRIAA